MENVYFDLYNYLGKEIYVTYYIFGKVKSKNFTLLSINKELGTISVYNKFEKLAFTLPFVGISMSIVSIRLDSKKSKAIYFNKYIYSKTLSAFYTDKESAELITGRTLKKEI